VYSEKYQAVASTTELVGFNDLDRLAEGILSASEWLRTAFGDRSTTILELWMQTTFLIRYKPILVSGQQKTHEINDCTFPADLANEIVLFAATVRALAILPYSITAISIPSTFCANGQKSDRKRTLLYPSMTLSAEKLVTFLKVVMADGKQILPHECADLLVAGLRS